ncbi:MAG: ribosome-associated translation inhibitor RaiA [bacterium]|nr:ribosome-associated translation inhibitor RaiA [bacterium]
MRVVIHKKNLEITPSLQDFIETKLIKPVEKVLKNISGKELPLLEIEIGRNTKHHLKGKVYHVEANLSIGGIFLRAEIDEDDAHKACDMLKDELLREIVKFKSKRLDVYKKEARKAKENLYLS